MISNIFRYQLIAVLIFVLCSLYTPISVSDGVKINDPTKPIYSKRSNAQITNGPIIRERQEIQLQSIFLSKSKKIAIINRELFEEGTVLDGVSVHKIHKNHVSIKYKGKVIKVGLSKKLYLDKLTGEISE